VKNQRFQPTPGPHQLKPGLPVVVGPDGIVVGSFAVTARPDQECFLNAARALAAPEMQAALAEVLWFIGDELARRRDLPVEDMDIPTLISLETSIREALQKSGWRADQ
jgi:hypothetical protein